MTQDISTRRDRPGFFWIAIAVAIVGFLYFVRGILLPFVMAMAIAYFFDPLVRRLQRHGLQRWLSALIVLLVFVVVIVGAGFVIVPLLEHQVRELVSAIPGWINAFKTEGLPKLDDFLARMGMGDQAHLDETATGYLSKALSTAGTVVGSVLMGGLAVLDLLSLLIVTPVVAFYLLRDWDRVVNDIDDCLPRPHKSTLETLFGEIDRTLSGFIRGQALVCLIQATYYAVFLTVFGLPFGALVGIATGILTFIPYLGAMIGLITGMIIAIAQWHADPNGTLHILLILGTFIVGQSLEAYVVTPKLVGDRIGLHPAWVIFAVLAGGALFGFPGILIAVPVGAVIGVLIRFGVRSYRTSSLYRGDGAPLS